MKIYLSGPMTGYKGLNYTIFLAAEKRLEALGHEVYNPARWEEYEAREEFNLTDAFCDYTRHIIRDADAVVLLPRWEESPGATAERALALAVRKPAIEMSVFAPDWSPEHLYSRVGGPQ